MQKQLISMADLPDHLPTSLQAKTGISPEQEKSLRARTLSFGDAMDLMNEEWAPVLKEFIEAKTEPLLQRIAALEARPHVRYLGPWKEGKTFSPGSMVSEDGGVWHCEKETATRPGTSADWVLAVKRAAK